MEQYKIDKDIPIPVIAVTGKGYTKYPFPQMEAGDSVEFEAGTNYCSIACCAYRVAKMKGFKFTCRKDKITGKFRVWRIQ